MTRRRVVALALGTALATGSSAQAAIFVLLKTPTVHRGGVVRLAGECGRDAALRVA